MSDPHEDDAATDDLAERVEELEASLRELRREVDRGRSRGPLGLPRPPRPDDVLRFADDVAIPATVAVLEANVRLLESLRRAIRMAEGRRAGGEAAASTGDAASAASRATLEGLEEALDAVQAAVERGQFPAEGPARDVLADVRSLRSEVDDRLREAVESAPAPDAGGGDRVEPGTDPGGPRGPQVDVEGELESLRRRYGNDDAADDGTDGGDGGGGDAAGANDSGSDDGSGDGSSGAGGAGDGEAGDGAR